MLRAYGKEIEDIQVGKTHCRVMFKTGKGYWHDVPFSSISWVSTDWFLD